MENPEIPETGQNQLQFDSTAISHLNVTRQWTNFLSIVGFVFIGLMAVGAFAIPSLSGFWQSNPVGGPEAIVFTIIMLLLIALYFFPIYYLYSFSRYSKQAIRNNDQIALNEAFRFLKKHYRFMGILTIIFLSFYVLCIIIALMAGSMLNVLKGM
jgi:hypothetical protein